MNESWLFLIVLIVSVIGLSGIVGVIIFSWKYFLLSREQYNVLREKQSKYLDRLIKSLSKEPEEKLHLIQHTGRYLSEFSSEYLERRNEFWVTYAQVVIALLVIVFLTILLLTKIISPEAGLPILSAVSGFAIAKVISGRRPKLTQPEQPKQAGSERQEV